jgi:hypothetical protein
MGRSIAWQLFYLIIIMARLGKYLPIMPQQSKSEKGIAKAIPYCPDFLKFGRRKRIHSLSGSGWQICGPETEPGGP